MKLVINALQFKQRSSGIGVCIRELFGRLAAIYDRQCTVVLAKDSPDFPASDRTEQVRSIWDNGQMLRRFLFQSIRMNKYCRDALLLTTDSKVPVALHRSCKVMPLVTDLAVFRMPDTYQKSRVLLWKAQYHLMKKHVIHWLAISDFTKHDMIELLGIRAEDITVVYCAASEEFHRVVNQESYNAARTKYALPEHYILFTGNFNPRKNLERLILAFSLFRKNTQLPHQLVIAGEYGWRFNQKAALSAVEQRDDIQFLGFVPDEDLPALYTLADLFVFPTLYEGFGIPVIEAQRCGCPVLTSESSALPEIAGAGAVYVDPYDIKDISDVIGRILTDNQLATALVGEGYKNAERFSWEASAQKLRQIIESVMDNGLHD